MNSPECVRQLVGRRVGSLVLVAVVLSGCGGALLLAEAKKSATLHWLANPQLDGGCAHFASLESMMGTNPLDMTVNGMPVTLPVVTTFMFGGYPGTKRGVEIDDATVDGGTLIITFSDSSDRVTTTVANECRVSPLVFSPRVTGPVPAGTVLSLRPSSGGVLRTDGLELAMFGRLDADGNQQFSGYLDIDGGTASYVVPRLTDPELTWFQLPVVPAPFAGCPFRFCLRHGVATGDNGLGGTVEGGVISVGMLELSNPP